MMNTVGTFFNNNYIGENTDFFKKTNGFCTGGIGTCDWEKVLNDNKDCTGRCIEVPGSGNSGGGDEEHGLHGS